MCDEKCGSSSAGECSGLMSEYNAVVSARQKFDELYNKQETVFKRVLTKVCKYFLIIRKIRKMNEVLTFFFHSTFQIPFFQNFL